MGNFDHCPTTNCVDCLHHTCTKPKPCVQRTGLLEAIDLIENSGTRTSLKMAVGKIKQEHEALKQMQEVIRLQGKILNSIKIYTSS